MDTLIVLLVEDPNDGEYAIYGPFSTGDEAVRFAKSKGFDESWVMPVLEAK